MGQCSLLCHSASKVSKAIRISALCDVQSDSEKQSGKRRPKFCPRFLSTSRFSYQFGGLRFDSRRICFVSSFVALVPHMFHRRTRNHWDPTKIRLRVQFDAQPTNQIVFSFGPNFPFGCGVATPSRPPEIISDPKILSLSIATGLLPPVAFLV